MSRPSWLSRSVDDRRRRALRRTTPGPLADLLRTSSPGRDTALRDLRLLAVDVETTGLDPATDRLLSVGWVPVDGRRIVLAGARRLVVGDAGAVGSSATVHGLTDDVLAAGEPLAEVLGRLLEALAGRVLLAHFARVETAFLGAACERLWGAGMPVEVVDTLELERRALTRSGTPLTDPGALRLWSARRRRGLPTYHAHEALTDALACAELYLAQTAERAERSTLRDVAS